MPEALRWMGDDATNGLSHEVLVRLLPHFHFQKTLIGFQAQAGMTSLAGPIGESGF